MEVDSEGKPLKEARGKGQGARGKGQGARGKSLIGIDLLTPYPFFGALPEASAKPNDDPSNSFQEIEARRKMWQEWCKDYPVSI